MSEAEQNPADELSPDVLRACAIAMGAEPQPIEPCGHAVFASKDYNSRGSCRHHWFRMRWTGSAWVYAGQRLPTANFRAAERCARSLSEVYDGELLITHDRGAGIDSEAQLVVATATGRKLVPCAVTKLRGGNIRIVLPTGEAIDRPNPRGR